MNNDTYFIEKTANGTNQVTLRSKLLEKRIIFLDEEVGVDSVNRLISQLILLSMQDNTKPVTLLINSPGGSIRDGLVLIDVIKSMPFTVKTVSLGIAASMAAVILAAGTKGNRYISENSWAMLHQPLIQNGLSSSSCSEVEQVAKTLIERKEMLNNMLSKLTGKDVATVSEITSKDSYLNSKEALEFGLVDKIADEQTLYELLGG